MKTNFTARSLRPELQGGADLRKKIEAALMERAIKKLVYRFHER